MHFSICSWAGIVSLASTSKAINEKDMLPTINCNFRVLPRSLSRYWYYLKIVRDWLSEKFKPLPTFRRSAMQNFRSRDNLPPWFSEIKQRVFLLKYKIKFHRRIVVGHQYSRSFLICMVAVTSSGNTLWSVFTHVISHHIRFLHKNRI